MDDSIGPASAHDGDLFGLGQAVVLERFDAEQADRVEALQATDAECASVSGRRRVDRRIRPANQAGERDGIAIGRGRTAIQCEAGGAQSIDSDVEAVVARVAIQTHGGEVDIVHRGAGIDAHAEIVGARAGHGDHIVRVRAEQLERRRERSGRLHQYGFNAVKRHLRRAVDDEPAFIRFRSGVELHEARVGNRDSQRVAGAYRIAAVHKDRHCGWRDIEHVVAGATQHPQRLDGYVIDLRRAGDQNACAVDGDGVGAGGAIDGQGVGPAAAINVDAVHRRAHDARGQHRAQVVRAEHHRTRRGDQFRGRLDTVAERRTSHREGARAASIDRNRSQAGYGAETGNAQVVRSRRSVNPQVLDRVNRDRSKSNAQNGVT